MNMRTRKVIQDDLDAVKSGFKHWDEDFTLLRMFGGDKYFAEVFKSNDCACCNRWMVDKGQRCPSCPLQSCSNAGDPWRRVGEATINDNRTEFIAARRGILNTLADARVKLEKELAELPPPHEVEYEAVIKADPPIEYEEGYRAATEAELDDLPEGARCRLKERDPEPLWHGSSHIGESVAPRDRKLCHYEVPIETAQERRFREAGAAYQLARKAAETALREYNDAWLALAESRKGGKK